MGKEANKIKVLHLETALEWRGGQQQISYLVQGLMQKAVPTALVCRPGAKIFEYFETNGLPVVPLNIRHGLDLVAARRIAKMAKEQGFNILHAHSSHALMLGLLVKMLFRPLKLVASRRVDFSVKKSVVGTLKYNNGLVDKVICISENISRVLIDDGVSKEKLVIIHDGIDINRFELKSADELRRELSIPDEHFVVGTVAALVGHKDYPNLLQAAKTVLQEFEKVTFVAVGDGGDRDELEALKRDLNLGNRFLFVGFRDDLERFYSLFDVFVLASHKEGLGTSVLDALACGLPVVGTRAGGIPEMIEPEVNGMLVPARDPQALASAILRLLKDEVLREKLAQNARPSVQKFSVEQMVQKHIVLYRSLLGD